MVSARSVGPRRQRTLHGAGDEPCMVYGYVDVKSRQEVRDAMAAYLAITEHAGECAANVLTPMDVQLIHGPFPYLRVRFQVNEADSDRIFNTGWISLYISRARKTPVFFTLPWPKPPHNPPLWLGGKPASIATAMHAANFLNTVVMNLGWRGPWGEQWFKGHWRYEEERMRKLIASGHAAGWMCLLKEAEREELFQAAERMRAQLDEPTSPLEEFPALGNSPEPAPAPCWPNPPLRINQVDQENLWRVAYLGAGGRFRSPEAVWLCGPSPIDLRKQVALRQPPLVTSICAQNL